MTATTSSVLLAAAAISSLGPYVHLNKNYNKINLGQKNDEVQ